MADFLPDHSLLEVDGTDVAEQRCDLQRKREEVSELLWRFQVLAVPVRGDLGVAWSDSTHKDAD